jgi:hypothetical protein
MNTTDNETACACWRCGKRNRERIPHVISPLMFRCADCGAQTERPANVAPDPESLTCDVCGDAIRDGESFTGTRNKTVRHMACHASRKYQDAVSDARDSLMRRSVSASDTLVVLEDVTHTYDARVTVAHISASGWVDVFMVAIRAGDDDASDPTKETRHVALTPSQFAKLTGAYLQRFPPADPEPAILTNCETCGTLIIANPVGQCAACFRASQPPFAWTTYTETNDGPPYVTHHLYGQAPDGAFCAACVFPVETGWRAIVGSEQSEFLDAPSAKAWAERRVTRNRAIVAGMEKAQ